MVQYGCCGDHCAVAVLGPPQRSQDLFLLLFYLRNAGGQTAFIHTEATQREPFDARIGHLFHDTLIQERIATYVHVAPNNSTIPKRI